MGSPVLYATLLSVLLFLSLVQTQDLKDQDVLCNENSCLVLYLQRKVFLEAWRSCKNQGGNLVTIKSPEDADMVNTLLSKTQPREGDHLRVWIGLQRPPRKCFPTRPLRGFSWVVGEQDSQYSNWQEESSQESSACSTPRCVAVGYSTAAQEIANNFKWKDGPCSVPVNGYLCRYAFPGMCNGISSEGDGNTLYTTPFHLVTSFLTHIPFGSVATIPCLAKVDQTVLCTQKEDGSVGWNREPPYCSDASKTGGCAKDNGRCHHFCEQDEHHFYCECNEGFLLAEDGVSCFPIDPCHDSPCEFECLPVMDSYRCACPEGYMLAPDEQGCLDVDECLQSPCEHICINAPGTFACRCHDGYRPDDEGNCEDIDECAENPCEHACENVIGSYICHCHLGFTPLPEDPSRCHDTDECQIKGTCEQMCINYIGGFDCYCEEGYELQDHYSCRLISDNQQYPTVTTSYPWTTSFPLHKWESKDNEHSWQEGPDHYWDSQNGDYDFLTELPTDPTDLPVFTDAPLKEAETSPTTESHPGIINVAWEDTDPLTTAVEDILPSTTLTPVLDDYEDESTIEPTQIPTTTVAGGAWNLKWFSPSPKGSEDTTDQNYDSYDPDPSASSDSDSDIVSDLEMETTTYFRLSAPGTEEITKVEDNSEQAQGSSWLLIGLLVPLCLFIVIMLVLGIFYCARSTAKPENKNTTDCYHWIAGAGDKAAADIAGSGISKV